MKPKEIFRAELEGQRTETVELEVLDDCTVPPREDRGHNPYDNCSQLERFSAWARRRRGSS